MKSLLFLFILAGNALVSQTIKRAVGLYSTEYDQKEIRGKSNASKVTLNTINGSLTVEDNLAAIRIDNSKADPMDHNASPISLIFTSNIGKDISSILKDNKNANLIKLEGNLTINGITKECIAFWAPIQFDASSSELLIDFELKFNCEDFKLNDLNFPFTKLVEFEIEDGLINKIE